MGCTNKQKVQTITTCSSTQKTKEVAFALFIGIVRSCWARGRGN